MKLHKKRKCPTSTICHCLVVDETNFFQCCGHYHAGNGGCGGRVNAPRQIRSAHVHWDDHQP